MHLFASKTFYRDTMDQNFLSAPPPLVKLGRTINPLSAMYTLDKDFRRYGHRERGSLEAYNT